MQSPAPELKNRVVRAGAGAGKTRGLVEQVVSVYRRYKAAGTEDPRIVLTTFTRKATQELKERLILKAVTEKDAELLQFVTDPSRLQIATIHGLLNVFLKQVGHLAGLDSGFQIVSEGEADHLARVALREILVENSDALSWLEVYGFERVLQMCRAYLALELEQGGLRAATVEEIEAAARARLAYWRKAFAHLLEEIASSAGGDEAWREYASAMGAALKSWEKALPDLETLPKKPRFTKKQAEFEALHETTEALVKKFKEEFSDAGWEPSRWAGMAGAWRDFQPVAAAFGSRLLKLKNEQARFEMSDLEFKALEILRAKPFLGAMFSASWDYWMIDEFQDTSLLQIELLTALIGEKPKYVVGDPQQSIYLFRGAEVEVFHRTEKEIGASGGEVQVLSKNYRSKPELLLWINDFMKSVGDAFLRMEPREVPAAGAPTGKADVVLCRAPDREVEIKALVARVNELIRDGAALEQICVISRTHRGLMDVAQVLKDYGYPTHVHASKGFSARREVIDARAVWKFLANPHDNLNLCILLRSPWFQVADGVLTEWMKDRPRSLWRELEALGENVPEAVARLREALEKLKAFGMARAFEEVLRANAMIDLSLHHDSAGRKESNLWKLIHKAQTLEKQGGQSILDLLQAEAENPLDATEGDATSAQEPNCINLMTIHGSKGLEFDHVLVPFMHEPPRASTTPVLFAEDRRFFFPAWDDEEGRFVASPLDQSAVKRRRERELQESKRWLYVALTRAKKTLTLSWSGRGKESWVEASAWFQKPKGLFREENYAYEVVEEFAAEPERYQPRQERSALVREPFAKPGGESADEKYSVSELVQREEDGMTMDQLVRRSEAQAAGSRVHRALEALKYGGLSSPADQSDAAVRFVLGLENPPLREWIKDGETEWGFQVQTPKRVIEGQIDLWAKHAGRVYVVDYKTGSPKEKEAAFKQLSLYAWALRKFGHEEPMQMIVVYPLLEKVETRDFSEELFLGWENEFGGSET